MSFPRYPAYKPSGVEWLGEVPEHWGMIEARREIAFLTSGSRGWAEYYSDEGPIFLRIGNLTRDGIRIDLEDIQRVNPPAGAEGDRTEVNEGDVLFSITAYLGSVAVVPKDLERAYVSQHVCLARLKRHNLLPGWLAYSVLSAPGKAYLESESYGGTKVQLSLDDIKSFPLSLPPVEEQRSLIAFLDRETAKIDALIAEQQRLIELLQEKRQAVISHAVTKGLNPDAPMKDSRVEWLGEVPEHWSVCSFRRLVRIAEGQVDPRIYPYSVMPLIAPNHILSGTGVVVSLETAAEQGAESGKYICEKGAVIYSKIRPSLRKACIAPEDCLTSADMYPLQAMEGLIPEFLLYFLLSEQFSALAVVESERVAMPKVNRDTLGAVPLAVPPILEQVRICSHIKKLAHHIDDLCGQAASSIGLMQERRSALISAAVTGQIDVRGLAPEADAA